MRNIAVAAAVAVAFGVGISGAFAQEAPLKQLAPGTVFTFNVQDGTTAKITVTKMEGVTIFQDQESSSGSRVTNENVGFGATLGTAQSESMSGGQREDVAKLFPLKVGNSVWSGHSGRAPSGFTWMAQDKLEVTEAEKITVPAGTFDTFVISTSMSNSNWSGQNTCWYAPEIGYCAKRKFRSSSSSFVWELASVATP